MSRGRTTRAPRATAMAGADCTQAMAELLDGAHRARAQEALHEVGSLFDTLDAQELLALVDEWRPAPLRFNTSAQLQNLAGVVYTLEPELAWALLHMAAAIGEQWCALSDAVCDGTATKTQLSAYRAASRPTRSQTVHSRKKYRTMDAQELAGLRARLALGPDAAFPARVQVLGDDGGQLASRANDLLSRSILVGEDVRPALHAYWSAAGLDAPSRRMAEDLSADLLEQWRRLAVARRELQAVGVDAMPEPIYWPMYADGDVRELYESRLTDDDLAGEVHSPHHAHHRVNAARSPQEWIAKVRAGLRDPGRYPRFTSQGGEGFALVTELATAPGGALQLAELAQLLSKQTGRPVAPTLRVGQFESGTRLLVGEVRLPVHVYERTYMLTAYTRLGPVVPSFREHILEAVKNRRDVDGWDVDQSVGVLDGGLHHILVRSVGDPLQAADTTALFGPEPRCRHSRGLWVPTHDDTALRFACSQCHRRTARVVSRALLSDACAEDACANPMDAPRLLAWERAYAALMGKSMPDRLSQVHQGHRFDSLKELTAALSTAVPTFSDRASLDDELFGDDT